MGLFKDYESAGSGISKQSVKKKGIALFFDILGRKFWKLIGINMLYSIFFLPLYLILPAIYFIRNNIALLITIGILLLIFSVLIGPATAAMTKIMRCFIIEKHTFIVRDFFRAFKSNFGRASIIGFIDCFIVLSVYAAINVYPVMAVQYDSVLLYVPMIITLSLFIVIVMMNFYIYLMLIATTLSLGNLIKNSFFLSFVGMKRNLITFAITLVITALMIVLMLYQLPVFMTLAVFFPAAFLCFIVCFNSYPVIQKYVINPYYTSIGQVNPELLDDFDEEEAIFEDMGGKEKPIEKRKKGKGRRIS